MRGYKLWQMTARNVLRNKRRALLTQVVIVFGVTTILFSSAFLESMGNNWRNALIDADLGHFQLMREDHRTQLASFPVDKPVSHLKELIAKLRQMPHITGVMPRISFTGLVGTGQETAPFYARAIALEDVRETLPRIDGALVAGTSLRPEHPGGALIGEGLAKLLHVKTGDHLLLTAYDRYRAMNAVDVTVTGILRIPDEMSNNQLLITDYTTGATLIGYEDEATELVVRTDLPDALEPLLTDVKTSLGGRESLLPVPWTELAGSFNQAARMFAFTTAVISGILLVVVLVTLTNAILATVFERRSEIGMLTAMGTPRWYVMLLFLAESLITGLLGIIVGTLIHAVLMAYTQANGIRIPPPPGAIEAIVLHPEFSWTAVFSTGLILLIVAAVAALYPARFAAKLDPVVAIYAR